MKNETNEFLRGVCFSFSGCIIGVIIGLGVLGGISNKATTMKIEVGMKISDLKWLYRAGVISEEEVAEYNKAAQQKLNIKEMNQLLDELLEGKEQEYLEERAELHEIIQSILDK